MARKAFKGRRFDTGGDIFKTPPAAPAPNPDIFKPEKPATKFVSNPVVQDISKIDRAKSDKGIPTTPPKTGGGFGAAFKAARAGGDKTFTWNGKSYNTAVKGAGGGGGSRPAGGGGTSKTPNSTRAAAPRSTPQVAASTDEEINRLSARAKPRGAPAAGAPKAAAPKKDNFPAASDHSSAASRARAGRMAGKAANFIDEINPATQVRKALWWGGKKLFKPANDADRAATLAKLKAAANAPGASNLAKDRYEKAKETGMYAKGGKTESPAMVKKEVDFFKKKKAPKSMIAHEEAELKQAKGKKAPPPFAKKDNPFASANSKAEKKGGNPFAKAKGKNPFAKADGKKGKPFPKAKSKPTNPFGFAKGGSIDGCAKRGHTKARGST